MSAKGFFATKADMEPGLRAFEAKCKMKYVRQNSQTSPELETYYSAFDIPTLGLATSRLTAGNDAYLMLPIDAEVIVKHTVQTNGEHWYKPHWDQNPGILFRPGGWYGDDVLMGGDVGITSTSEAIYAYWRVLGRALTKGFTVIPDLLNYKWWVGPEALVCLDKGIRLVTRTLDAPDTIEDLRRRAQSSRSISE